MCSPSPDRRAGARIATVLGVALAATLIAVAGCDARAAADTDVTAATDAVRATAASAPDDASGRVLRVCADPNNLPFSNRAGEGFENRLAELVAGEMGATVRYTWWADRKSTRLNSS